MDVCQPCPLYLFCDFWRFSCLFLFFLCCRGPRFLGLSRGVKNLKLCLAIFPFFYKRLDVFI